MIIFFSGKLTIPNGDHEICKDPGSEKVLFPIFRHLRKRNILCHNLNRLMNKARTYVHEFKR